MLFSRYTLRVTGRVMKMKDLGPLNEERADKIRIAGMPGAKVILPTLSQ